MSSYENYARVSAHYDTTRVPVGVEIILGALAEGRVSLAETHLLDAGCGTGTYAAAVAPRLGRLTLLDASEEMLAVARGTLDRSPASIEVELRPGRLESLPFEDESFDAVMTNQVLHHLGDEAGGAWPAHREVVAEYARVLRPGGVLVINTCSPEQLRHGYWYYALIPDAVDDVCRRYAPLEAIEQAAEAHGLVPSGRLAPVDATIQGADYFDAEGPLSDTWRLGDSIWSLVGAEEMAAMTSAIVGLRRRGDLSAFVTEHDARRPAIGQITFIVAKRDAQIPG